MDPFIKQTIDSYAMAFDTMVISDPALQAEINNWKQKMEDLGNSCPDVMSFMEKVGSSGLQEEQMQLITKASAPPASVSVDEEASQQGVHADFDPSKVKLPTVPEFLEQFRPAYNTIKAQGYRFKAEAAYEQIFNVAERTDDLLEMNVILEEEELLWKIVVDDFKDIYSPLFEAQDPNNKAFYEQFKALTEMSETVRDETELDYYNELVTQQNIQRHSAEKAKMSFVASLTLNLMLYQLNKLPAKCKGKHQEEGLRNVIGYRQSTRNIYNYGLETFGWDIETLRSDPWLKIWFLAPIPLDETMRIKQVLDPKNIDFLLYQLEECLSNEALEDILMREEIGGFGFYVKDRDGAVQERYKQEAKQRNAELTFFKYMDKLQSELPEITDIIDDSMKSTTVNGI